MIWRRKSTDIRTNANHTEKILVRELLKNYGNRIVVPHKGDEALVIRMRTLISQMVSFDEKLQQVQMHLWVKQEWRDDFLAWNPGQYGGINTISVSPREVWQADITLEQSIEPAPLQFPDLPLIVNSSGDITWYAPLITRTTCKVKVKYFPFDVQTCALTFGSWVYDSSRIRLEILNDADASQIVYSDNGIWDFVRSTGDLEQVYYPCCDEPYHYAAYEIHLRRKSQFYVLNVVLPSNLLSILNFLVFWMPVDAGEKVSFVTANLLAIILFQQLVGAIMPPLGDELPIIVTFFFMQMVSISIIILETVLVLRVYFYDENETPIPRMIKRIVQGGKRQVNPSTLVSEEPNGHASCNVSVKRKSPTVSDAGMMDSRAMQGSKSDVTWKQVADCIDRAVFFSLLLVNVLIYIYTICSFIGVFP